MLELAHFKQGDDAVEMIELAISKFQAALKIEPRKHDALWCLGNALTSQGFLFQEAEKACSYFDEAKNCLLLPKSMWKEVVEFCAFYRLSNYFCMYQITSL